jgi:hypothetical protein
MAGFVHWPRSGEAHLKGSPSPFTTFVPAAAGPKDSSLRLGVNGDDAARSLMLT